MVCSLIAPITPLASTSHLKPHPPRRSKKQIQSPRVPDLIHRCMYCMTVVFVWPVEVFRVYLQWHVKGSNQSVDLKVAKEPESFEEDGTLSSVQSSGTRQGWVIDDGLWYPHVCPFHLDLQRFCVNMENVSFWWLCDIWYKTLEWRVTVYILNHLDA